MSELHGSVQDSIESNRRPVIQLTGYEVILVCVLVCASSLMCYHPLHTVFQDQVGRLADELRGELHVT